MMSTRARILACLCTVFALSCSEKKSENGAEEAKAPKTEELNTKVAPDPVEKEQPKDTPPPIVKSFSEMTSVEATLSKETAGSLKKIKLGKDLNLVSFASISFLNEKQGFATGNYQTMLETADGGKTWKTLEKGRSMREGFGEVIFTSETDGVVAVGGNLKRTKDGGKTWEFHSPGLELKKIFFSDKDNAWGVVPFKGLARSKDAGQTWKVMFMPSHSSFDDVYVGDDGKGWLMGHTRNKLGVWRSEDGGETWTKTLSLEGEDDQTHGALGMTAISGNEVWLAGQGYLINSKDGGKTWTRYQGLWKADAYFQDVVVSGDKLWVAGFEAGESAQPFLVYSADGGVNWAQIDTKLKPNNMLVDLQLHGSTLWAAGAGLFTVEQN